MLHHVMPIAPTQLHVQGTTTVENVNAAFDSIDVSSPVMELHWREGLDYIYAANGDSVSFTVEVQYTCTGMGYIRHYMVAGV